MNLSLSVNLSTTHISPGITHNGFTKAFVHSGRGGKSVSRPGCPPSITHSAESTNPPPPDFDTSTHNLVHNSGRTVTNFLIPPNPRQSFSPNTNPNRCKLSVDISGCFFLSKHNRFFLPCCSPSADKIASCVRLWVKLQIPSSLPVLVSAMYSKTRYIFLIFIVLYVPSGVPILGRGGFPAGDTQAPLTIMSLGDTGPEPLDSCGSTTHIISVG